MARTINSTGWNFEKKAAQHYDQVKSHKSHTDKDELIGAIASTISLEQTVGSTVEEMVSACEQTLSAWCASSHSFESELLYLRPQLEGIKTVTGLHYLKCNPDKEIDLVIISNDKSFDLYQAVSNILVQFEDRTNKVASYMVLTEAEYEESGLSERSVE